MAFITNLTGPTVTGAYTNGQPSGITNNGGTIHPGGVQSGSITGVEYGSANWSWGVGGDTTIITVPSGINGVTGINEDGPWNYNNPTGIIPTVTTEIAGLPFDGMIGGASNSANSNVDSCTHWSKSPLYKHAVVSGWWSQYRGQFSFMTDETETSPSGGLWNISTSDVIASCSGQVQDSRYEPGEIVYNMGGLPTQTGYGPRYNW